MPGEEKIKYVPIRGLMDSGSEAFLISSAIIPRAGITEADLQPVMDLEIHGLEGVVCRPRFRVELTWHMRRHANSRVSTFFVVEDRSFDILVPSSLLLDSRSNDTTSHAAYILHLRKKKAGELHPKPRQAFRIPYGSC